jgi:hypothetical protein
MKALDSRSGWLGLGMASNLERVAGRNMTEMGLEQTTVLFALWHDSESRSINPLP